MNPGTTPLAVRGADAAGTALWGTCSESGLDSDICRFGMTLVPLASTT